MIRFINKFLGALLRLLVIMPFYMLAIICTPLLFFDRLLQSRPMDALLELMRMPLKILFLLVMVVQTLYDGWVIGVATLMSTLTARIRNFFQYEIGANADFFFSTKASGEGIINHYEGPLFGRLIRKIIALSFPYEQFKSYETFHDNPHNSDSIRDINAVYTALRNRYEHRLLQQEKQVERNIDEFLQMRTKHAATPEEIKFAKDAENCHRQFKENMEGYSITAVALDVKSVPKPLWILYLVWMALEEEATKEQSAQLKELLASFMTQIQWGIYRSHNPTDTVIYVEDQPECATGAVAILLEVLKSLPNSTYKLTPPKVDSIQRLRELLHLKLNDSFTFSDNVRKNAYSSMKTNLVDTPLPPIAEERFKREEKRPLSHYARFLVQTPQGNHLLNGMVNLNNDDIQATVDATIDEWQPRP